jgi:hypothetical protein
MMNYSTNGLYFESDNLIEEGEVVHIAIKSSPFSEDARGYDCYRALIVWCEKLEESFYTYGYGIHLFSSDYKKVLGATELFHYPDRRKHQRKCLDVSIDINVRDKKLSCITKDISETGAFIDTTEDLTVGEHIFLAVGNDRGLTAGLEGKVVRISPEGFGIKFFSK